VRRFRGRFCDPGVIAEVEKLPLQAFSIFNHQQIFKVMLELHQQGFAAHLHSGSQNVRNGPSPRSSRGKSASIPLIRPLQCILEASNGMPTTTEKKSNIDAI